MITAKFVHPESGYPHDAEKAKKAGLIEGRDYPVSNISMGQPSAITAQETSPATR